MRRGLFIATSIADGWRKRRPSAADLGLPAVPSLSSFGEDACGRVYVASLDGPVYRLADGGGCVLTGLEARSEDTTAPMVNVRVKHLQRVLRTGVLQLRVRCDEQCTVRTGGALPVKRRARAAVVPSTMRISSAAHDRGPSARSAAGPREREQPARDPARARPRRPAGHRASGSEGQRRRAEHAPAHGAHQGPLTGEGPGNTSVDSQRSR
jgi:hypothetical protein